MRLLAADNRATIYVREEPVNKIAKAHFALFNIAAESLVVISANIASASSSVDNDTCVRANLAPDGMGTS